jgi:tripartite-type tricarboxylate transporter receptor subunit TctC
VDVVHVPYRGSAPATAAIVSGETQFMFDNLTASLVHIKAGKLHPIAVTGATREPELPEVPTATELGLQDFDKVGWMGFFLPAQTPPAVVRKLTDSLVAVLRAPEVARRYRELGGRPGGMPQAQFMQLVDNDRRSWGALITSRQLQLD